MFTQITKQNITTSTKHSPVHMTWT